MTIAIAPFETALAAKRHYQIFVGRSAQIPTLWDVYLAAWKAGAIWQAHTYGKLLDTDVQLAIRALAGVVGVLPGEQGMTAEFKSGAEWFAVTSARLSDPEFRLAIRALAEILLIERGDN